jgi:predicted nucleotidyltransferase component of viral defense system
MSWQLEHDKIIDDFLSFVNSRTDRFVLKGGTGFKKCYNLDRFSEDIDFDAGRSDITSQIVQFCKMYNFKYRESKKTGYTQRFFINYGNDMHPLKVEVSTRRKEIPAEETTTVNGIRVYTLDNMAILKASAFRDRDKIRDLYDLVFIVNNYFDQLSHTTKLLLTAEFEHKGLEQFDFLISTQSDDLINKEKFANDVLKAFDNLDLLYSDEEKTEMLESAHTP